ncbi:Zn-dependent exopeptidase [Rhizoctonia solani]|uniref:Peptide hydrolase n=1 Tax=Rhizoctonia solani TaxID=456999 RepID=A0A8H7I6A4_9AGAM|nr:Zn-dependent exopeptidase [Rhizoctonia solani]
MKSFIPFILTVATYSLGATSSINEFDELSLRYIKFSPQHIEKLPLAAIERLRAAAPLPRPLTAESLNEVRASLSDISTLTGSTISDEVIEQLQGRFQRKLWGPGYIDVTDSVSAGFDDSTRSQTPFVAPITAPSIQLQTHQRTRSLSQCWKWLIRQSFVTMSLICQLHTERAIIAIQTLAPAVRIVPEPTYWIEAQFASWLGSNQTTVVENKFNQPNIVAELKPSLGVLARRLSYWGLIWIAQANSHGWLRALTTVDASGLSVVMAIMRILKANDYQGSYAIEAHAYAGEEGGLLGSDALARAYKDQGKEIRGMIEFEMVGYQPSTSTNAGKSSTITVLADPVPSMTSHMIKVVEAYVPTAELRSVNCGYGCSDHYSFFKEGYPVVCLASYGPNDKYLNPNYHAMSDTVDKLDFEKMTDFVRAGLGWVVEVAA